MRAFGALFGERHPLRAVVKLESVEDRKHALKHAHSAVHYGLSNVRTQFGPDFEFVKAISQTSGSSDSGTS